MIGGTCLKLHGNKTVTKLTRRKAAAATGGRATADEAQGETHVPAGAMGRGLWTGPPVMLRFRFTCQRHQRAFIEAVQSAGCFDPAQMDEVRRRMLAWFSRHYPSLVLDHFRDQTCLGCEFEARFQNAREALEAVKILTKELLGRSVDPGGSQPSAGADSDDSALQQNRRPQSQRNREKSGDAK